MKTLQIKTGGRLMNSSGSIALFMGVSVFLALAPNLLQAQQSEGLKLPADIEAKAAESVTGEQTESNQAGEQAESTADDRKFMIEERRIGGRLERVTVYRKNGLDETYENPNVDSMWITEDKELGETQNVRRWTIGTW